MRGIDLIRQLIRQQTVSIGEPVSNLYGAAAPAADVLVVSRDSEWLVLSIPGARMRGIDEFYAAYYAQPDRQSAIVPAPQGAIVVGQPFQSPTDNVQIADGRTYLVRGLVDAESPVVATLDVASEDASGEFAVYLDGVLQRRGYGSITVTIALDVGGHTIDIMAAARVFGVAVPSSLMVRADAETLTAPIWSAVSAGYADPAAGTPAVNLAWFTDPRVGGWVLRRRELSELGQIVTITPVDERGEFGVELVGDWSGVVRSGQDLLAGRETMGLVLGADYDGTTKTSVRLRLPSGRTSTSEHWMYRLAMTGQFVDLARIRRTDGTAIVTYVDTRVATGVAYDYVLQPFGLFSDTVLGPLSEIEHVRGGDSVPPASITFKTLPTVLDNRILVKYRTPDDEDYAGTRVYFRDTRVSRVSSGANTTLTLSDDTQTWASEQWANYAIGIVAGTGIGQIRRIVTNDATVVTIDRAWDVTPNGTSAYEIFRILPIATDHGVPSADDELIFSPAGYGTYFFPTFDWGSNEQLWADAVSWTYSQNDDREYVGSPRTTLILDERTPDGAVSATVVRMWFQSSPSFTDLVTGTSSGSNTSTTLKDISKSWTTDQYQSLLNTVFYVRIVSGTGAGQMRKITANTATQLTVGEWAIVPDNTSHYVIQNGGTNYRRNGGNFIPVYQPEFITRSLTGDLIEYFSELNGFPPEALKRAFIDGDSLATIASVSAVENVPNVLDITIDTPDDDVKEWLCYARRGSTSPTWPTVSGQASDPNMDDVYLRFRGPPSTPTFSMSAGGTGASDGTWYIMVVPINSFGDRGPATAVSTVVDGVGDNEPALAGISVVRHDNGTTAYYNQVLWNHSAALGGTGGTSTGSNTTSTLNDTGKTWTTDQWVNYRVEIISGTGVGQTRRVISNTATQLTVATNWSVTPDATSKYEVYKAGVKIFAYRDDIGPGSQGLIHSGTYRNPRADTDGDFTNTNDPDTVAAKGTVLHGLGTSQRSTQGVGVQHTWYYILQIWKDIETAPVQTKSYQVTHTDYYFDPAPAFSGSASVSITSFGSSHGAGSGSFFGDQICDTPHRNTITWTVTGGNDTAYRIDIDVSTDGGTWDSLAGGISTYATSYVDEEWGIVDFGGGTSYDRTYRVEIVRKIDGVVTASQITNRIQRNSRWCDNAGHGPF